DNTGTLSNDGTIRRDGTAWTEIAVRTLTNDGTLAADQGEFDFGDSRLGPQTLLNRGTITTGSGSVMYLTGTITQESTGRIDGAGTVHFGFGGLGIASATASLAGSYAVTGTTWVENGSVTITGTLLASLESSSQFSQIIVTGGGALNLGGPLQVVLLNGYTPHINDEFTIIDNRGAVTGTFTDLPEGATIQDTSGAVSTNISYLGGDGNDVVLKTIAVAASAILETDPCDPAKTALVVRGTAGNDTIVFSPGGNSGDITVKLNGVSLGTFHPTGRIIAYGQAGDDDIQVAGSITLPTWLYGGDGNDRLKGGSGPNVLLGGAGDDLLVGGSNRDILIDGTGADRLVGNANDDILIAGRTTFDNIDAALAGILAEWTSSRDYATRVANLSGTGNGPRLNGNVFLQANTTVLDDGMQDVLTGSSGQDWFWANYKGSGVLDKITDLSASEFANDLDFINS
ncbi:MAG TPA: hypothetical protein VKI65_05480, partial [Gemmataceae bacterium]|nr:hypothetical protein [Gemmataceae bacterium]